MIIKEGYKEGYKVLYKDGKFLYSTNRIWGFIRYEKDRWIWFKDGNKGNNKIKIIKYENNRWVGRPKFCGPIAVFDTIDNVNCFLYICDLDDYFISSNIVIYKVKYVPSKINYLYYFNVKEFVLPEGTQFAEKVYLLEEIC